jgi:hypothetical protein
MQMDEKTQKESEAQTEPESSAENDSGPSEKKNDQNNELLEKVSSEPESKGSELKTPSLDQDPDDGSIPDATETDKTAEKLPAIESADETSSDGIEIPPETEGEIETETGTKDADLDEGGAHKEDTETEKVVESDSFDIDKVEEIQGSPEEKAAIGEVDDREEGAGGVEGDDADRQTQIEAEADDAEKQTDDLAEEKTIETSSRKKPALKMTVAAVVIAAVFAGFFVFDNKSKIKANSERASKTSENRESSPNRQKKNNIIKPIAPEISSIYNSQIEAISTLRDTLLRKQEEVRRLKKHYQDGIEELEKEIADELQKGEVSTFLQAMENKGTAFTLRTIQRRQAYIQQLERPSKWILKACEELLYIKRQTVMDIQVAEIAAGIDMNKHVRHINAAVRKYQPTADKLALDMTNAQPQPLESIWDRIQDKTRQYASIRAHSKNQIISEQICTGNFTDLTELSEISTEIAKCVTEMQASDLFLNGLTEISPGATRQLVQWNGSWICLNGVRALSPRVAHYLFQWDGNWISLNGLTEFPAEIGETLLKWGGHQLELMGLQYAEDFPGRIALKYLARWEQGGGKLFVPQSVRKKIDEIQRN